MICSKCGTEYFGDHCPNCSGSPNAVPDNNQTVQHTSYDQQNDYKTDLSKDPTSQTYNQNGFQNQQYPNPGFCPKCGEHINGNFCSRCGFCIHFENQHNPFTTNYQNTYHNQSHTPHKSKNWVIVLIVVVCSLYFIILPMVSFLFVTNGLERFFSNSNFSGYSDDIDEFLNQFGDELRDRYEYDPDYNDDEFSNDITSEPDSFHIPNGVSIEEYEQLEKGMTYAQISAIIGGDAYNEETKTNGADEKIIIATWPGETNVSATVTITFINNVASDISQQGLLSD